MRRLLPRLSPPPGSPEQDRAYGENAEHPRSGDREADARIEDRRDRSPKQESEPWARLRDRLEQRDDPGLVGGAGELLDGGHHAYPLDAVARPSNHRGGAGEEQGGGGCGAEIGAADRQGPDSP